MIIFFILCFLFSAEISKVSTSLKKKFWIYSICFYSNVSINFFRQCSILTFFFHYSTTVSFSNILAKTFYSPDVAKEQKQPKKCQSRRIKLNNPAIVSEQSVTDWSRIIRYFSALSTVIANPLLKMGKKGFYFIFMDHSYSCLHCAY